MAPMYYAWPVETEIVDSKGKIVGHGKAVWPLLTLLPGGSQDCSVLLTDFPGTVRIVLLRISHPMPDGHTVAFATAEMTTVFSGWLTLNLEQRGK